MAFRAFFFSFFDPNMVALTWAYSRYFMPDDGGIHLVSSNIKKLNSLEQIRQIGAEQSQFTQIRLKYSVSAYSSSRTAVFERETLSSEELEQILECCDQQTDDPMRAVENTRACWEKLFSGGIT